MYDEDDKNFLNRICSVSRLDKSVIEEVLNSILIVTNLEIYGERNKVTIPGICELSIDYCDEIKRQTGIDITTASLDEIKNKLDDMSVKYDGNNLERLVDTLWKTCRKNISGPAFVVGHPTLIAPLAKMATSAGHTSTRGNVGIATEMFQPIIAGSEIGRGYSELNDPIDQKARFEAQQKLLDGGDKEAMMPDMEFVEMLEHGMPPTCGFGFGERFFAFLADKPLRELQLFPLMRPK